MCNKPRIVSQVIKQANLPNYYYKNKGYACIYDLYVFLVYCDKSPTGKNVSIIYNGNKLIEISIDNNIPSCKARGTYLGTSVDQSIHKYTFINMDNEMYCRVYINALSNDVFVYLFKNRQFITLIES